MLIHSLNFNGVSFCFDSASNYIFDELTLHFPSGWTGVVGANGVGKTTLLGLAIGDLQPTSGSLSGLKDGLAVYCRQRTDTPPRQLLAFLESSDFNAFELRGRLNIDADWPERWNTLSHGERKRAQIGVALWQEPDVLAIDEPTNHIDREARDRLLSALHSFRGIGLIVSHDRALLDDLCLQCLFIDAGEVVMRPGGYSQGMEQQLLEKQAILESLSRIRMEKGRIRKELTRRREEAIRSKKRVSKRGLAIKDHDARGKRNRARLTGKDGTAGRLTRQMSGRLKQIKTMEKAIHIKKQHELGIWVPGSFSPRKYLLELPADQIELGPEKVLNHPDLLIGSRDRIALTGSNGNGKSTLLQIIMPQLNLDSEKILYLPQEISTQDSISTIDQIRRVPRKELGMLMTIVSRLGSRPQALLESELPSPGEMRKLLLALGIVNEPHLIILDEPTNHLDLPSIECLENALSDCPCALLLVSHDELFLRKLSHKYWHLCNTNHSSLIESIELTEKYTISL